MAKNKKIAGILIMIAVILIAVVVFNKRGTDRESTSGIEKGLDETFVEDTSASPDVALIGDNNVFGDISSLTFRAADYQVAAKEFTLTEENYTASASGVLVDFGQYNIEGEETLEIRELPQKTEEENGVLVKAYDIKLGSRSSFDDVITITIPYDESYVESGAEGECVGAKYYDESTGQWEGVPYAVDTKNKQVLIFTTHLSTYGVFQVKNENTRKAYITDVYALGNMLDGSKSFEVIKEFAANGEPGNAAFEAGFTAVNGLVGDTGTAITAFTLGGQYEGALADTLGKATQHTGLALSLVQTYYDFSYNFTEDREKLNTLANLVKNIANNAVGYFGSAALQLGFSGIYVFDILLSEVQNDMMELKLENIGDVYQYYNDREAPRSNKEWRKLFIQILRDNADDPEKAKQMIEKEMDDFCDRFWALDYGKVKEIAGVSGKKYSFDERNYTKDREVLTEQYKAYLMYRLQAPLTSARNYLMNQAMEAGQKDLEKQLRNLQKELNKTVKVQIVEQPEKYGEYQYGGYRVKFAPLSSKANPKNWEGTMPSGGTLNTSFTILGHMQSGSPNLVELYAPGENTPELSATFLVSYPTTTIVLQSKDEENDNPTGISEDSNATSESPKAETFTWVLKEVIDNDNAKGWEEANNQEYYEYAPGYAPGSYSLTWTYVGESDDYYNPPYVHGESYGVQAGWSGPPSELIPGELLELNVSIAKTADTLSAFKPSGSTRAYLNGDNMTSTDGKSVYEISEDVESASGTVTATIPEGNEEGSQLEIEITFHAYVSMSTRYIYQCQAQ